MRPRRDAYATNFMKKIGFQRLLAAMGLLVIVLLAAAFILGILSLKRTQEIVSDDFQRQQLILARATARQLEDGLAFLRRELRTLAYSPAIQYLEDVAWGNRMRLSFEELSRLGVTAIVRLNAAADRAYTLDAGGPRVAPGDFSGLPAVAWAKDPANRGRIYQGPIRVEARDGAQVAGHGAGHPGLRRERGRVPSPAARRPDRGAAL